MGVTVKQQAVCSSSGSLCPGPIKAFVYVAIPYKSKIDPLQRGRCPQISGRKDPGRVATSHTLVWLLRSQASFWLADTDVLQIFSFYGDM